MCVSTGDTASNLGSAVDELMRHQPTLKTDATTAIIKVGSQSEMISSIDQGWARVLNLSLSTDRLSNSLMFIVCQVQ